MLQGGRAGTSPLLLCPRVDMLADARPLPVCLTGSRCSLLCCRRFFYLYMGSAPQDSPPHCWICGPGPAGGSPLFPAAASRVDPRWRLSTSAAGPSWLRPAASRDHRAVWARAGPRGRAASAAGGWPRQYFKGTGGDVFPAPVPPRRHARRRPTVDPGLQVCTTGSRGSLLCCRRCYDLYMGSAPDSPPHCRTCRPGHAGHSPLLPAAALGADSRWRLSLCWRAQLAPARRVT